MAEPIEPVVYYAFENLETHNNYVTGEEIRYNSYSGADITAHAIFPWESDPLFLGELQTISYSIHRENKPVRTLGHTNPRGFVRGPRLIAGSMIFVQFDSYAFYRLNQWQELVYPSPSRHRSRIFPVADMLPPFDLMLNFSNEYGSNSTMTLYGVTIIDEGGTFSIEDLVSEATFTYVARGIKPLTSYVTSSTNLSSSSGGTEPIKINVLGESYHSSGLTLKPLIN